MLEELYVATIARHQAAPPSRESVDSAERYFLHDALPRKPGDPPWVERPVTEDPRLEQLRAELDQRMIELRQTKTALNEVYSSRSWRLTGPLRAIRPSWLRLFDRTR